MKAKDGVVRAFPVEFHGFDSKDARGQPMRVTEVVEGDLKWAVHDNKDIGPAGREKPPREPAFHPTRHRRLFYNQADADFFKDRRGFRVLPAVDHVQETPRGPKVPPARILKGQPAE